MTQDTFTIKDNSTGKEADFPLRRGTIGTPVIDVSTLHKQMGAFTYDPGFMSTSSCKARLLTLMV